MRIDDKEIQAAYDYISKNISASAADQIYSQAMTMFPKKIDEVTEGDENKILRKAYILGALNTYRIIFTQKSDGITANPVDNAEVERVCDLKFRQQSIKE